MSHTGAGGATDQDQKQPFGDRRLGQIFFANLVLALAARTVDQRNVVRLGIAANATAETAGQAHQVGIVERLVRAGQRPPPHPETTGIMPHSEKGVQYDAIDAIVAAAQQILVESAQLIRHAGKLLLRCQPPQTAPKGPLFRSPVWEKA
jgi:hypothetical protein